MLTKHFSKREAIASARAKAEGIVNEPTEDQWKVISHTASQMELVRKVVGTPLLVNSWFRSPSLNSILGGSSTSQHLRGEAVDFRSAILSPYEICRSILNAVPSIPFDQLILYPTFVHISFTQRGKPRRDIRHVTTLGKIKPGIPGLTA